MSGQTKLVVGLVGVAVLGAAWLYRWGEQPPPPMVVVEAGGGNEEGAFKDMEAAWDDFEKNPAYARGRYVGKTFVLDCDLLKPVDVPPAYHTGLVKAWLADDFLLLPGPDDCPAAVHLTPEAVKLLGQTRELPAIVEVRCRLKGFDRPPKAMVGSVGKSGLYFTDGDVVKTITKDEWLRK